MREQTAEADLGPSPARVPALECWGEGREAGGSSTALLLSFLPPVQAHPPCEGVVVCCDALSRSVVSDSLQPHGLKPARLLCPWGFSRPEHWSG